MYFPSPGLLPLAFRCRRRSSSDDDDVDEDPEEPRCCSGVAAAGAAADGRTMGPTSPAAADGNGAAGMSISMGVAGAAVAAARGTGTMGVPGATLAAARLLRCFFSCRRPMLSSKTRRAV